LYIQNILKYLREGDNNNTLYVFFDDRSILRINP